MASVNKVILVGNLGRAPEIRYMPSGEAVANVAIATSHKYKNSAGEAVEETEWHRVSFFGKLAEVVGEYLRKGKSIYVEGRLKTRKYTDKDGVEKYATEIIANNMQMLGGRDSDDQDQQQSQQQRQHQRQQSTSRGAPPARPAPAARQAAPSPSSGFDDMDDDIPFVTNSMHFDMTTSKARRMERYGK